MSTGEALLLLMQTIDEQERLIKEQDGLIKELQTKNREKGVYLVQLKARNQQLEQEIVALTRETRNEGTD